ncbi:MAG: PIN domain-containing protein [Gammaproteobacteria bacterium]|nr:PIN domain-containing protein [Gammaproteobacteria bacterium]
MAARRKTKKRAIQSFAFIDTNIFLDFYRAPTENTLSLLEKLDRVKDRVICTYQIEMEFLKNRQTEIMNIAKASNLDIDARLPAVMGDSQLDTTLKRLKQELDKRKKQLEERVARIIDNPSGYDPIYSTLETIFASEADLVLTRDMSIRHSIKRRAWRRFILGYPPRKKNDTSIGDALNWEWIIHCAQNRRGKIVIVSRDSDYGCKYNGKCFLNDALKKEFRDRVGKKSILYTDKLSEALKELQIHVTKAEEKSEQEQIRGLNLRSDLLSFDPQLMKQIESQRIVGNLGTHIDVENFERFKELMRTLESSQERFQQFMSKKFGEEPKDGDS